MALGRFNETFQNFVKNYAYCEKVKEFQRKFPISLNDEKLPLQEYRVVLSDYGNSLFVKQVLFEISRPIQLSHVAKVVDGLKEEIRPDITLFMHITSNWHKNFKIGTQFLCPGQLYNHIPGNAYLSFKDIMALSFREYGKYYKGREHCFDP